MWGARFAAGPAAVMERINASIGFDRPLYAQDIAGSKSHCAMLLRQGIAAAEDGAAILAGLAAVRSETEAGAFVFNTRLEALHRQGEAPLAAWIGAAARRPPPARHRTARV